MALDPNDKRVLAIKSFACEALEIDDVDFDDALNEELTLVKDFVDNMWKERWQPMLVYKVTEVDAINGSVTKVRFAYPAGRDSSINMPCLLYTSKEQCPQDQYNDTCYVFYHLKTLENNLYKY